MLRNVTRSQALDSVRRYPRQLSLLPDYQDNRDVVIEAVSVDGNAYEYASDRLKNDKEVVLIALNNAKHADIWYAIPARLKEDPEVIIAVLNKDPWRFERMPSWVKDNYLIVASMVKKYGNLLAFASERLQQYPELRVSAVLSAPLYLENTPELQDDRDVVLQAIKKDGRALEYASDRFKNDYEYAMIAVRSNGYAIEFTPLFQNNLEILKAASYNAPDITMIVPTLRDDVRFLPHGSDKSMLSQRLKDEWNHL